MPSKLLGPLGFKIAAAIAVLALAFTGIQTWRLSSAQSDLEEKRTELANEEARHAVTRQTVGTLMATIKGLNRQAEQRAAAFAEAQELAKKRDKELADLARSSNEKIERLRRIAERGSDGLCEVPADLARELEGL